jgi:HSP20 family protein
MKGVTKYQRPSIFQLFDDAFFNDNWGAAPVLSTPSVNIKEGPESFVIEMAAPGLTREDFNIEIENDQLIVSASKESSSEETREKYSRREFNYASFTKKYHLDDTIDADKISASYDNGVLHLTLPKKEEVKTEVRKIEIG